MERYYIDASALAKAFFVEVGTASVLSLLERTEDRLRLFSALTPLEVRSAIRRKQQQGELSDAEVTGALHILAEEMRRTEQMPLTQTLLHAAEEVMDHFPLRAADAIQLAAALAFSDMQTSEQIVFVACDKRLLAAATKVGLKTHDPIDS